MRQRAVGEQHGAHLRNQVQRFTVVDKSDTSPSRLTVLPIPLIIRMLTIFLLSSGEDRSGFPRFSVSARGLASPLSRAAWSPFLASSAAFPFISREQTRSGPPSAQEAALPHEKSWFPHVAEAIHDTSVCVRSARPQRCLVSFWSKSNGGLQ
jgi:hypothetical protein